MEQNKPFPIPILVIIQPIWGGGRKLQFCNVARFELLMWAHGVDLGSMVLERYRVETLDANHYNWGWVGGWGGVYHYDLTYYILVIYLIQLHISFQMIQ